MLLLHKNNIPTADVGIIIWCLNCDDVLRQNIYWTLRNTEILYINDATWSLARFYTGLDIKYPEELVGKKPGIAIGHYGVINTVNCLQVVTQN